MVLLTPQRIVVMCVLVLCSLPSLLQAQEIYQGSLDGIYPVRLVIEESNPQAILSVSTLSNKINFIGGCTGGKCKYRGIDTALTLVFERTDKVVAGRVQFGDGTSKEFAANQVDDKTAFANNCNSTFWMRTWVDASRRHHLTLATLPGKQVKGTFFVAELGASFSVSGTAADTQLELMLEGPVNKNIGSISAQLNDVQIGETLQINLDLDGTNTSLNLILNEEMNLNCMQAAGRYDMVYPNVEGTSYSMSLLKLWKEITKQQADYSYAWFEPTLFNAQVISGWMHIESPAGRTSEAINFDRQKNREIKQGKLLGGKRSRTQLVDTYKARAIAQHPLQVDGEFQDWAKALDFSNFTLSVGGVSLASKRHPVYGQLETIVPWRELPKADGLPVWITPSK